MMKEPLISMTGSLKGMSFSIGFSSAMLRALAAVMFTPAFIKSMSLSRDQGDKVASSRSKVPSRSDIYNFFGLF